MEIKMCTCPNGHYYNADIYSSCPECGAGAGGAQGIPPTAPAGAFGGGSSIGATEPVGPMGGFGGFNASPVGKTEPIMPFGGSAEPIGKTMPANDYMGGASVTKPVEQFPKTEFAGSFAKGPAAMSTEPVVGWLVCVDGPMRGVDFRIHDGYNFIGRETGDIVIQGDNTVSRQRHAVIAFYAKRNTFYVGPAEGKNIIELNDEPVFNHVEMKSYDVITVGNTKLMLVALCGPKFNWIAGVQNG